MFYVGTIEAFCGTVALYNNNNNITTSSLMAMQCGDVSEFRFHDVINKIKSSFFHLSPRRCALNKADFNHLRLSKAVGGTCVCVLINYQPTESFGNPRNATNASWNRKSSKILSQVSLYSRHRLISPRIISPVPLRTFY